MHGGGVLVVWLRFNQVRTPHLFVHQRCYQLKRLDFLFDAEHASLFTYATFALNLRKRLRNYLIFASVYEEVVLRVDTVIQNHAHVSPDAGLTHIYFLIFFLRSQIGR